MTLDDLRGAVLFQTGRDREDLEELEPFLTAYLNEGYDRLLMACCGEHVSEEEGRPPLAHARSSPELPDWAHRALADYAAWMVLRTGNARRQAQGQAFLAGFLEAERRLHGMGGAQFTGIPE